jgi:hypothetical protein
MREERGRNEGGTREEQGRNERGTREQARKGRGTRNHLAFCKKGHNVSLPSL